MLLITGGGLDIVVGKGGKKKKGRKLLQIFSNCSFLE